MHGDVLDLILIVIVAAFAVSGYRQGFIVGVLSFFGFVDFLSFVGFFSLLISFRTFVNVFYIPSLCC